MPTHVSWGSIELLHNVVRTLNYLNERDGTPLPRISYRSKVKLHGTNCAVQVREDGVSAQSRRGILTLPSGDLNGFARWVMQEGSGSSASNHLAYFRNLAPGITIFGEWCGPGVEKGMAISQAEDKVFAVFAIQVGEGALAHVVYDPEEIASHLHGSAGWMPKNMYVLPWHSETTLAFGEDFDSEVAQINASVDAVEAEDPWVKQTFGLSGVGEGLVFYPVGEHATGNPERLFLLMFKAKGDKHRTAGQRKPAQVSAEVVNSIDEFVDLMVTEARLIQGVSEACGGELHMRHTGKFLQWVCGDVEKESAAELEAASLTWDQVQKGVQARAREWLRSRV